MRVSGRFSQTNQLDRGATQGAVLAMNADGPGNLWVATGRIFLPAGRWAFSGQSAAQLSR
eukprot:1916074-Pyramimonas_sp.AAC.2